MNATKFIVLLLIGVVCVNVGAIRQLEGVSKETQLDISIPKTATTNVNGLGAELSVIVQTSAYGSGYGNADATAGPSGSNAGSYGSGYGSTSGSVTADGPNASAYSSSSAYGQGGANATAGPSGATANGNGSGGGSTVAYGSTGP